MDAQLRIDSYINNVAGRPPRKLRNGVGLDSRRGFEIIEPEHAPAFLMLSAACVAIQWALTLPGVFAARTTFGDWWHNWGFSAFAWIGMLALWFGLATWIRGRSPVYRGSLSRPWMHYIFWLPLPAEWRPVDREAIERRASKSAFLIGVVLTIFFIAPTWFLHLLTPAGTNTSWALYDADLRRWLLPPLIVLMVVRLGLFAATVSNDLWRARMEAIRFGLWICFVGLLYWVVLRWNIFAAPLVDALFKMWLLIFLLVNTVQIVVWIRRARTRVRVPKNGA